MKLVFILTFKLYSLYNLSKLIEHNKEKINYSGKLFVEIYSLWFINNDEFPNKKN